MRNKRKRFDECEDIKEELSEIRKQMSQMMSMLTNLSISQQEFNNKMNNDVSDIKEQMTNIKTNIQNLTIEQNTIKSDILNIKSNNNITNKNVEALQSEEPANYEFSYKVSDYESGSDFGHAENRQDDKAEGTYSVVLPDGTKQVVEYEAGEDGFKPRISVIPADTSCI
ncbi:unnamed protein product [Parnassius apollo]|uniref:(apollo) hypothetical protein n=1 Tax=Parnassius apollo TaxID=110799 RepID=A0A8S3WAK7_PARAO|nr:unnamed protein product [Parnassius apollo]